MVDGRPSNRGWTATFYQLRCATAGAGDGGGATVERRYSDFEQLRQALKAAGKDSFASKFPGKLMSSGAQRQAQLEQWSQLVLGAHADFDAVKRFFAADAATAAAGLPSAEDALATAAAARRGPPPNAGAHPELIVGAVQRANGLKITTYYQVQAPHSHSTNKQPPAERRFNDFEELKERLEAAGEDAFSKSFPPKLATSGSDDRRPQLEQWLRLVLGAHAASPLVKSFFSFSGDAVGGGGDGGGAGGGAAAGTAPAKSAAALAPAPPAIVGVVQRGGRGWTATFYQLRDVVNGSDKPGAERRFTEFEALEEALRAAGKERFEEQFAKCKKSNSAARTPELDRWLQRVLAAHAGSFAPVLSFFDKKISTFAGF